MRQIIFGWKKLFNFSNIVDPKFIENKYFIAVRFTIMTQKNLVPNVSKIVKKI